jgi:excisionase family DNA binding protein
MIETNEFRFLPPSAMVVGTPPIAQQNLPLLLPGADGVVVGRAGGAERVREEPPGRTAQIVGEEHFSARDAAVAGGCAEPARATRGDWPFAAHEAIGRPPGDAAGRRWLTVAEAAAAVGVSTDSIYGAIKNGSIKARRFGRVYRISATALAEPDQAGAKENGNYGGSKTEGLGRVVHRRLVPRPAGPAMPLAPVDWEKKKSR